MLNPKSDDFSGSPAKISVSVSSSKPHLQPVGRDTFEGRLAAVIPDDGEYNLAGEIPEAGRLVKVTLWDTAGGHVTYVFDAPAK